MAEPVESVQSPDNLLKYFKLNIEHTSLKLYFLGFPTIEPGFPQVLSQRRMHFSVSCTLAANFGSH